MDYQTFRPQKNLETIVKCYWTLEVPAQPHTQRQLILPDGCIDMCFILGDDIKRYTAGGKFILQPRQMILGQITEPFYVEPTGSVKSFAIKFYPFGLANFLKTPLFDLANKETPLNLLFGNKNAGLLGRKISEANSTAERIEIIEDFLIERLHDKATIDSIVKTTVDTLLRSKGGKPINSILKGDLSKRRQLERKFIKQIGISPKQLGKAIRLQATLQMLLNPKSASLTEIAYENEFYDQAHFIKDFKEFTGVTPKEFLRDDKMTLSALLYKKA
jgi:Helix-turn-helix domain